MAASLGPGNREAGWKYKRYTQLAIAYITPAEAASHSGAHPELAQLNMSRTPILCFMCIITLNMHTFNQV